MCCNGGKAFVEQLHHCNMKSFICLMLKADVFQCGSSEIRLDCTKIYINHLSHKCLVRFLL